MMVVAVRVPIDVQPVRYYTLTHVGTCPYVLLLSICILYIPCSKVRESERAPKKWVGKYKERA